MHLQISKAVYYLGHKLTQRSGDRSSLQTFTQYLKQEVGTNYNPNLADHISSPA